MKNTQLNPNLPGPACPACLPPWLCLEGGYATHRPILLSSQPSHGPEPLRDVVLPFHTLKYPDYSSMQPSTQLGDPCLPHSVGLVLSALSQRHSSLNQSFTHTNTSSWTTMMFRNIMFSMYLWLLLLRKHTQRSWDEWGETRWQTGNILLYGRIYKLEYYRRWISFLPKPVWGNSSVIFTSLANICQVSRDRVLFCFCLNKSN